MKVKDVMTAGAQACATQTNLAVAAALMWDNDCGVLPVLDLDRKVVGMITDRDICFGAATKHRAPSEVSVGEVITGKVFACGPEDDIHDALKTMRHERVRRLPVVGEDGTLHGILSMNDVVLKAENGGGEKYHEITYGDVVKTYKAICEHALLPHVAERPGQQAATA